MSTNELINICYKKNFVSKVILKLNYSQILSLISNPPEKFQEEIRDEFPVTDIKDLYEITTGIKQGDEFINKDISKVYVFSNKEKTKQIEITPAHIVLVFSKYFSYVDFLKVVKKIIDLFKGLYSPLDIRRIGLRFVNEVRLNEGNPLEWDGYINKNLIANLNSLEGYKEDFSRVMSQMHFKYTDYSAIFNYGLFNIEFPNKISRKEFILDYDCFAENISEDSIYNYIEKFHQQIQCLFEKSINDELRKIMS